MGERIIVGKEGELIRSPLEKNEEEMQREEWQKQLEKVRAELKNGSELTPDKLGELWAKQRSLEKKLGIQIAGPPRPPGQYL